jgi:hypothetical protein
VALDRRIDALERLLEADYEGGAPVGTMWAFNEQVEEALEYLRFHQRYGRRSDGSIVPAPATDRQINILGALWVREELEDGVGEYRLPASGTRIKWTVRPDIAEDAFVVSWDGDVSVADLPEGVKEYIYLMDPKDQPRREQFLYAEWQRKKRSSDG